MRKILNPWAANGNRRSIPDTSSDGTVSYDTGYGPQYSGSTTSDGKVTPAQRPIDREGLNGLLYDITDNIREWQQKGIAEWVQPLGTPDDPGYNRSAMVRYANGIYQSLVDGNTASPTDTTKWDYWYSSQDLLWRIPHQYQGATTTGMDFNGPQIASQSSFWDFNTDQAIQTSQNAPNNLLVSLPATYAPMTAGMAKSRSNAGSIVQMYIDSNAQVRPRGYLTSASAWNVWGALADNSQTINLWLPAIPEGNTADWNTFIDRGIRNVYGFTGPNGPPVDKVNNQWGTLQVFWPKNWFGLVVQTVTKYNGSTTQVYSRIRRPDNGAWSGWTGGDLVGKLDRRGDSMSGDLIIAGKGLDPSCSTELEFRPPNVSNGPTMRANSVGAIEWINREYNQVNATFNDNGSVWLRQRPVFVGNTPWDTGNFDPNSKVSVIGGRPQGGYTQNLVGNTMQMWWDGNIHTQVDSTYTGYLWHTNNFQPGNYANNGANCQWQSGRNQLGPIQYGHDWEAPSPYWLTGVGSNGGGSTANNIYMSARIIQNQGG